MIDTLGGRKIVSGLVLGIIALIIVLKMGDIPEHMATFLEFLFGALVVGNGIEHVSGAFKTSQNDSEAPAVDLQPVHAQVDDVQQKLNTLQTSMDQLNQNDLTIAQSVSTTQQLLTMIVQKYGMDK